MIMFALKGIMEYNVSVAK